jgi:hypothetical protein
MDYLTYFRQLTIIADKKNVHYAFQKNKSQNQYLRGFQRGNRKLSVKLGMRLFFLCFEPLGRYNGYRWPYNPFNAQPSVGNVRLSAVESRI